MYSNILTKTRHESVIDCSEWAISGYVTSSSTISFEFCFFHEPHPPVCFEHL